MTSLLTIRDGIKDFFRDHDTIVTPAIRFLCAIVLLFGLNALYGYSTMFSGLVVILALSFLCAVLSEGFTLLIVGIISLVHCLSVSLEAAAVFALLYIVIFFLYVKYCPRTAYVLMFTPLVYLMNIHYIVPIVVGILLGPVGIVPAIFGVVIYYFSRYLSELNGLLATAAEDESVQSFSYLISGLLQDRKMVLTVIVFAIVIIVTYLIYRTSAKNAWYIAIISGAVSEMFLMLIGGYAMEAEINAITIIIGTLVGMCLAFVVQFFKGTVDYSRTEIVQFEDDEYYYYVKAVPKLTVSAKNVNVKKINTRDNRRK
ncbi:MAG: hypothetical protein K2G89_06890 [Lachnospiraceae bacterium]|nr:hypothetical protein [Lachnospiraceae bacterium]